MRILVTGAAGFIGFHLVKKIRASHPDWDIVGFDNYNDYYDPKLKEDRASILKKDYDTQVRSLDLCSMDDVESAFADKIDIVVNLAAQAGVRYSIENPMAYVNTNMLGFAHLLEVIRHHDVGLCLYASSSSVYGNETQQPLRVDRTAGTVESLYAATKISNELMASVYAKHYKMNLIGLRFFTVYGSWGRPDMAYYSFADAISHDKPIKVFNYGDMERDFTHVSDIVNGIYSILERSTVSDSAGSSRVYNIGRGQPVRLMDFISTLEEALGKAARIEYEPMQPGDVASTWADTVDLERDFGYLPQTDIKTGIVH